VVENGTAARPHREPLGQISGCPAYFILFNSLQNKYILLVRAAGWFVGVILFNLEVFPLVIYLYF